MSIENGSHNNEIQSQEINQSNSERREQQAVEHQRFAEELEANPTIDNEGERKQIEGKNDDGIPAWTPPESKGEDETIASDDSIRPWTPPKNNMEMNTAVENGENGIPAWTPPESEMDDKHIEAESEIPSWTPTESKEEDDVSSGEDSIAPWTPPERTNSDEMEGSDEIPAWTPPQSRFDSTDNTGDDEVKDPIKNDERVKAGHLEAEKNAEEQAEGTIDVNTIAEQPKRFEDYTSKELWSMMDNPDTREQLKALVSDYQERYSAECLGMSVDEYRTHCALCESADEERSDENSEPKYHMSEVQQKASQLLERYDYIEEKTYFSYGAVEKTDAIGREGGAYLTELESTRADIKVQLKTASEDFARMKEDGTMLYDPEAYKQKYSELADLRATEHSLSNRAVKIEANLEILSESTGKQYGGFEKKPLSNEEINKTIAAGEIIYENGVFKKGSVVEAIRTIDKLDTEVLPSLHEKMRDCDSRFNDISVSQESYLKEHNCTREEALLDESSIYSKLEQQKETVTAEKEAYSQKFDETLVLSDHMHNSLPVSGQNRTLSITKNTDGTYSVESLVEVGIHKGPAIQWKLFSAKMDMHVGSTYYKDTCVFSQFDGQLKNRTVEYHNHGLGYKHEISFGSNNTNVKNSFGGNILNRNFTFGFSKGTDGKVSKIETKVDASLFEAGSNTSVTVKGKEILSAEVNVSAGKTKVEAKADSNGMATVKVSAHSLGAEATGKVLDTQVAKVECKINGFSGSVSTWDALTGTQASSQYGIKESISFGGKSSLYKNEVKDGVQKESSVPLDKLKETWEAAKNGEIKINQAAVKNAMDDYNSVKKSVSTVRGVDRENQKAVEDQGEPVKTKEIKWSEQTATLDENSKVQDISTTQLHRSLDQIVDESVFPDVVVDGEVSNMWIEVHGNQLLAKTIESGDTASFFGRIKPLLGGDDSSERIIGGMEINVTSGNQIILENWASSDGTKGVGTAMMDTLKTYAQENGLKISAQAVGCDGSMFGIDIKNVAGVDLAGLYHEKFGFDYSNDGIDNHMIWTPKETSQTKKLSV